MNAAGEGTSGAVNLLFGVHAHQPAGNFPAVIRDARDKCYGPFLEVLERHPEFPFAIHISGWLMGYLLREFPDDMRRLRAMVGRGQAELFGGGDTEPVLAALPDVDRRAQVRALNDRIRRSFSSRPRGAWLTERVWEAAVVPALADGGVEYVAVDDYHFLCAGERPERLDGYFTTEEDVRRLDLYPISETLRYKFPFAPVGDAIGYLESLPPGGAAIYFDDIEKFGIWPETHDWVYARRWLEDFIEAVGRSSRIVPMSYGEHHKKTSSRGIVYLPTVSYIEMGEWALPPQRSERYAYLIERAKRETSFAQDKPFLRGGHWRNFFSRYPESNWMHKRMESASRRLQALPAGARTRAVRNDLHLAQANDAYWHGLFGGIYLPHLRRQVFSALARVERVLERHTPRVPHECVDLDLDGREEIVLANSRMLAVIKPHDGASVREFTHYGLAHNFCDTLMRREEHYYHKIRAGDVHAHGAAPASIHDRIAFRTHVTDADLQPDRFPRNALLDFWAGSGEGEALVEYGRGACRGASAAFAGRCAGAAIKKRVKLTRTGLVATYAFEANETVRGTLTVELNIAMPSCDGPGGAYIVDGAALGGFADDIEIENVANLELRDSELGGALRLMLLPNAVLRARPLYTVSQSEAGFEKIMQAATLRASWPIEIEAGSSRTIEIRLSVKA